MVIAAEGVPAVKVGQRMMRLPDESQHSQIGDDSYSGRISRHLAEALRLRRSALVREPSATGSIEVFVEYLPPPLRLVVFGAGPDALPLVRQAKALGWHVSVVDGRPHHARAERFPLADAVLVAPPREAPAAAGVSERSAVVVMTHSYEQDKSLLRELLRSPPDYIGQLGPRSRTERMLAELAAEGAVPLEPAALHYPIGLDIGGETPEEIALAIVAQIKAVLAGRPGGTAGPAPRRHP
ncbi:MAG: XdhC family protein [Comamonadaceae bacterium]|nr:XdhC family protein [Comamonadaceae bacterium]